MATITGTRVRWTNPLTRERESRTFPTVAAAMAHKLKCESDAQLLKAGYLEHDQLDSQQRRLLPVEPLLVAYLDELTNKRKRSDAYVALCGRCIRRYLAEQRVDRLCDLDTASVKSFLDTNQRAGWSATTVNAFRAHLTAFCRWLTDFKYIPENPVTLVRRMDPLDERARLPCRALTLLECDAILKATPCPTRRALYLLRMRTGLRVLEASRVLWGDLDLVDGILTMPGRRDGRLNTKNKRDAVLPLSPDVCEALDGMQRETLVEGNPVQPTDRVFPTPVHGRTFDRDLDAAGVAREINGQLAVRRGLRKTFSSMLLEAGVDPIDVLLLMRHRPPGGLSLTLGVYADEGPLLKRKRAAMSKLVAWMADQRAERRKQA